MTRNASPSPEGKHIPDRRLGRSWRRSRDYLWHVITVKLKMYKFLPGPRSQPQNPLPGLPDLLGPDGLRLPAHAGPSGTARFPGEPVFQNPSLRPSCRMRGSRAERTLLKFTLAIEKDAQQTEIGRASCRERGRDWT